MMRILISAYACEPGRGSEPGVGWNWAREFARYHEVWVVTRVHRREKIEQALAAEPHLRARFIYYDLPRWTTKWWKKGQRGVHLHYHLWQIGAYFTARRLARSVPFDYVHHVTFGTYWKPSFFAMLPIPFIWGPLGGGEAAPASFRRWFHPKARMFERVRDLAQFLGRWDPFVRLTARRACLALAKTEQTAEALRSMGCSNVAVMCEAGLPAEECAQLFAIAPRQSEPFRVISLGRLVHWKGFELGLRAFALLQRQVPQAEYWLLGDGPERSRLERLSEHLGIAQSVRFLGNLPRADVLRNLADCDVLLHPSLHDSGGWVCLEAMAAAKPVVCLDTGGPSVQVTSATGFKVPAIEPEHAIESIAAALIRIAVDAPLRYRMGNAGRAHVAQRFAWDGPRNMVAAVLDLVSADQTRERMAVSR